ncbi:MAG: M23 family metallopeptidase [Butyricicoccaceae bacterium]
MMRARQSRRQADGTVRETGESSMREAPRIVDHADGFSTLYAHCSSISVEMGEKVGCGSEIAQVGQTGNATGPHLHLEIWRNGAALDPADYLTEL